MIIPTPHSKSPHKTTLRALAIGDRSSRELAGALAILELALPTRFFSTLAAAAAGYSKETVPPDLLVLLQSHSGQFPEADLLRLRACMPLARAVVVLGTWSEGELRSGRPLAAVRRVPWHAWPLRLAHELAAWQTGSGGTWALPATAAEDELLLETSGPTSRSRGHAQQRPIAVRIANPAFATCVIQALTRHGWQAACLPCDQPPMPEPFSALIDDLRLPADAGQLSSLYRAWQPRPIIVLADFARPRDEQMVREAGADVLLAKPLDLDVLSAHLDRMLAASTT